MKKIGVLGLMAALAVTGAVAFLPKGVMAAEDSDQTISQGVYIGDVDVSGMTQEEAKKAVEDGMSEAKAANITLKVDDQETVVSAKDLGLSWANEEVVQEAADHFAPKSFSRSEKPSHFAAKLSYSESIILAVTKSSKSKKPERAV